MKSATIKTRVDEKLYKQFAERCAELGLSQSEVLRRSINNWLRQTSEIKRMKEVSNGKGIDLANLVASSLRLGRQHQQD